VSRDPGRPEATTIEWANADGSDLQRLTTPDGLAALGSWSGDGKALVFHERPGGRSQNRDLWMLHPGAPEPRSPFLVTPFNERAPVFSPNGRWIAYVSNESGRDEVYVRPYSGPEQRVTVSSGGGTEPVWARNGRELFYREGDRMMVVSVSDAGRAPLSLGPPQQLFEGSYIRDPGNAAALPNYDVNEDGRAFLMIQPSKETTAFVVVVLNWFEELKRLVPTN
jgi:serine/threonine-protein kinase